MNVEEYNKLASDLAPEVPKTKNALYAFLIGGCIGLLGQILLEFFMMIYKIDVKGATPYMVITMILLACVLTGLGVYDRLGKIAGAGSFIPITGFANSMTSSAMEGKSEGIVLGIGASLFKLGGTVITFGVVSSFLLGGVRYVIEWLF